MGRAPVTCYASPDVLAPAPAVIVVEGYQARCHDAPMTLADLLCPACGTFGRAWYFTRVRGLALALYCGPCGANHAYATEDRR